MKSIQSQLQNDDLKGVVERIVRDLENAHTCKGKLSIERVVAPPNVSPDTPAGYPHLTVEEEASAKFLGLIPHIRKRTILMVKEGFYDISDQGRKDMFVVLKLKACEAVARKYFNEYGARHHVTEITYKS